MSNALTTQDLVLIKDIGNSSLCLGKACTLIPEVPMGLSKDAVRLSGEVEVMDNGNIPIAREKKAEFEGTVAGVQANGLWGKDKGG